MAKRPAPDPTEKGIMTMQKKWIKAAGAVLALSVLLGALAGCGQKKTAPVSSTPQETSSSPSEETSKYSGGLDENGYFEGVKALDYVTLPDYKGIAVPEETRTVSEEAVENELNERAQGHATVNQVKDRAVKDGDSVNIDYVGSVDGVEFQGGNTQGNGTTVTIGVTNYIDDFLEQLIGHTPGETFDVNVTFPENYGQEDLNGKDAVFVTTINYIEETVTPELTDDFVAENWKETDGWSNLKEARAGVEQELRQVAVANYLWGEIEKTVEISEIPQEVLDYQERYIRNYYTTAAEQYNMEVGEFLQQNLNVESLDALVEQNRTQMEKNARSSLILQALSEEMGLTLTEEDFTRYFEKNSGSADYSRYEKSYGKPYLGLMVRENLVMQKLGEQK